jgi:hypothetical protein
MFRSHSNGGGKVPFESHLERLSDPTREAMVDLRSFVLSLGSNVIEEIRPHRVVYAKTLNFRTFLDVEPSGNSLLLSIKSGKSAPTITITVKNPEEVNGAKEQIYEAYRKIQ